MRRRKGTPFQGYISKSAFARAKYAEGWKIREIADACGVEYSTVSAAIYHKAQHSAIRGIVLRNEHVEALAEEARRRKCSPSALASRLLTLIVRDDLVDGVLDDG